MSPVTDAVSLPNGGPVRSTASSVGPRSNLSHELSAHDQYSDGKAAKVWELYIGETSERTSSYKDFLVTLLRQRQCENVLDAACGNGIDSVMLVEEGFAMVSSDASDKMLKGAYKTRWNRRKEPSFDKWIIEESNWLTLTSDIAPPPGGFDAIMCMGNSFAHLPDLTGDQEDHILAIRNFHDLIKPGGMLIIDHRNYDYILDHGQAPKKNIYYNSKHIKDIKTSILLVNNHPNRITLDYEMEVATPEGCLVQARDCHFQLSYYPHRRVQFETLLKGVFGPSAKHSVFADFKSVHEELNPAFFIHVIEKAQ
eukprot:maker-scaffold301_size216225-snap-gene-0.12 protein:Tk06222 transcript:maker-scaffold301_size216225-snap-gene-0.12-mRNA-1 annotation:"glycine n-methyltransferase-like"